MVDGNEEEFYQVDRKEKGHIDKDYPCQRIAMAKLPFHIVPNRIEHFILGFWLVLALA